VFGGFPEIEREQVQEEEKFQNYSLDSIPKDHSLYHDLKDMKTKFAFVKITQDQVLNSLSDS